MSHFPTTIPKIRSLDDNEATLIIAAFQSTVNGGEDTLRNIVDRLPLDSLVNLATLFNLTYRAGKHIISDNDYDHIILAKIAQLDPANPYLHTIEDEGDSGDVVEGKVVTLPQIMLSTDKAYSRDVIETWLSRILKAADDTGVGRKDIELRITPKLDGFASFDDAVTMYTRGNGIRGTDIGRVLERGLQRYKDAPLGLGAGEIVVDPSYFEEHLSGSFENTRNVISGVLREKELNPLIKHAIENKGVVFAPFSVLDATVCSVEHFNANYDNIIKQTKASVSFDIDGVIIEVTNKEIKDAMGATTKAHRWMIALKENEASVEINVLSITPQTSRKGRVVPVLELEPTKVSGVTVSRVTAHNYTNIVKSGIGCGAIIELVRAGLVIPKIVGVKKSVDANLPETCPSCGEAVAWGVEEDGTELDLVCNNVESCPAQAQKKLLHWFSTIENIDGFGPSTIQILSNSGINSIPHIYRMSVNDFMQLGFGEKTSQNLVSELNRSRTDAVEDYRFLAAFGIRTLGRSMSETILSHHSLDDIFMVSKEQFIAIDKVGNVKADCISHGLTHIQDSYSALRHELGFNLIITPKVSEMESIESPIAGKNVVFTGTMLIMSRSDMTKQAKSLGAKVGSSVSSNTDYLVTGEKVGAAKNNGAKKHGVAVITEAEYFEMLGKL